MSELGMTAQPAPVIEAEFEVEDLSRSAQTEPTKTTPPTTKKSCRAGPQSSTELVAAPRDRDD